MGALARRSAMVLLACLAALGVSPVTAGTAFAASASTPTKLTAQEGTEQGKFGISVWIDGNTAVIGAPDEDGMGAAYVFTRRGAVWTEEEKLVAPVRSEGGKFGYDVGLSGDTIVVGAPKTDQTPIPEAGAAHVFVRTPEGWARQAELSASDGKADDAFGFGVAISGDTILVGANDGNVTPGLTAGAAYVYSRVGGSWSEQARLVPADGAPGDGFGYTVALSDDTAVITVPGDDVGAAVDQGSARVFVRSGTTWNAQATLTAEDGSALDQFGESPSISGDTVVVGAAFDDIGASPKQGSAYVFTREGGAWKQEAKLTAPDGDAADLFGRSVAVNDKMVVVGAHFAAGSGALYAFDRNGLSAEPTKLAAPDGSATTQVGPVGGAALGVSVAVSGHTVVGGAGFAAIDGKAAQGAAYVFDLRPRATGVIASEEVNSTPRNGSDAGSHARVLGQSQIGATLPATGGETRTPTLVALMALSLGWLLVLSARAAKGHPR